MERCPNCRARSNGADACRRCGIELGLLIAVEKAAERLTAQAVAHIATADLSVALRDLDEAVGLRREPFAELLLGFARYLDATQVGRGAVAELMRQFSRVRRPE